MASDSATAIQSASTSPNSASVSRPNETRVDVVSKEVFRGSKQLTIKYIKDCLKEAPEIVRDIKNIIKTQNTSTSAKVEAVVRWIESIFEDFQLSKTEWNEILPIAISELFKSKYEIMLRKMTADKNNSNSKKKTNSTRNVSEFNQMVKKVTDFK